MSFEYTERRIELMLELYKVAIKEQLFKSCLNCIAFNSKKELCELNNLRPPAEIVVYGCEMHDFDIPF